MKANLKDFINNYVTFNDAELDTIAGKFQQKHINKNGYLLTEGKVCKDLVFVQSGCLRMFYVDKSVEISVWFSFKNTSAIDIYSFISEKPSIYFIQAIENCELFFISKAEILKLYLSQPKTQEMMRNLWEDAILNLIERFTALQRNTAEERYINLMANPPYLQKIPQKFLASYIGVTPTSLSRIRKNIR